MTETPETFASRFPSLWRLAEEGSHEGIRRHGLLTAVEAAELAGERLSDQPRKKRLRVRIDDSTWVHITDNAPLSFPKLEGVLMDGLTPERWLAMLNERVFFWPVKELGEGNLQARKRLRYVSEWQEFDTLGLLSSCWDRAEVAHINTGSTVHQPVQRGLSTFAPLDGLDYDRWRRRRRDSTRPDAIKGLDTVKEVTVRGGVPEAGRFLRRVLPCG